MDFSIRASTLEDCKDIARMILELAEYEKVLDQVKVTQKGHAKVGYALYFYTYSSWKGRALYMEDLYVMPEFRGKGIGKALMSKVAQLGLAAGCTQLNFAVLDWNKPSLDFYLSQGCFDVTADMGYHCMRCEGAALEQLAQGDT
ncbi:unnamed protein product [Coregonus sp. 'balchen']|nr:unnamed protein product [Coregonus sp. 'balchen']